LFGGPHQPDLGGQRRTGPAGVQQRGQHRPQLPDQGQRHHRAQRGGRAEIHQVGVSLQAQHHADEQARDQDDGQRQHADRVQLLDQQTGAAEQKRQRAQQLQQEQVGPAQPTQPIQCEAPQFRQRRHHVGVPVSKSVS